MTRSKQIIRELDKFSKKREENVIEIATIITAIVFGIALGLSI